MGVVRREIMPGIWLNYLNTGKFKTSYMSLNLLTQLKRETASLTAPSRVLTITQSTSVRVSFARTLLSAAAHASLAALKWWTAS